MHACRPWRTSSRHRRGARDEGKPESARVAGHHGGGPDSRKAASSDGGLEPRTPGGAEAAAEESDGQLTPFDVSVGISPRQSFESWGSFVAQLEAEGVRRV